MQERLTIVLPPALGEQLARAVHAVCAQPAVVSAAGAGNLRARLACGDFENVRDALHSAGADAALPLAVARYLRWSGDVPAAAALWPLVREALDDALAEPSLRAATLAELPAAATDAGDVALAAHLIGAARSTSPHTAVPETLRTADETLVCDVAYHLLGLEPDATRGRLHLRPRLIEHSALDVRHVRFADGSVSMSATVDGDDRVIRVVQDDGAVPFTVLLEPLVPRATGAVVDDTPADLAMREAASDGVIVPVQLVLDDVRTLVIPGAGTERGRPQQ